MAVKLGATFMTCAMGPVNYAASCIQASRMPEALESLAPAVLLGGFQLGVGQAAKLAGVPVEDVERQLPVAEVRAHMERLSVSQRDALEAWSIHAGRIGGLLQGVAELTIDGRAPNASLGLERIARKVERDPAFSEPLQGLADDVARWQQMIVSCRRLLDESGGGTLAKAYNRRRLRHALVIGASSLLVVSAVVIIVLVRAARGRVDALLASADVCAVRGVAEDDLARGSSAQRQRVAERLSACVERQAREEREREERERAAARALEAQRSRAQREAKCQALAERIKAGAFTPEDEASAGDADRELLRRIARRKLLASDVGPGDPRLPCDGARGGDELLEALADALVASVWTWVPMGDPGAKVVEVLATRRDELPMRARMMLAVRAEDAAKRAVAKGHPEAINRASRLCVLSAALGFAGGAACTGIAAIAVSKANGQKSAPGAPR